MIKSSNDDNNHEVAAQFVAELETTFKLPVVESQVLKKRYENLQRIHQEVTKLEEKYSNLLTQNAANSSAIQALTQRRDFLVNLYNSFIQGSKLQQNASIIFSTTEIKIKDEIMQLEEALNSREDYINRLKREIDIEERKLKNAQAKDEGNKEIIYKNEINLNELENQREALKKIFEADQKVVKKMEEYFFKMTTNLFELQKEFDKRTLHLTHEKIDDGNADDEGCCNERLNKGWHRISHIMEDMGKDQLKYLKSGINENNFEEYKWELNESEKQWLSRELSIQKQKFYENQMELKTLVNETKALTKEFLIVIEETECLLKKYAEVECKNMTTDLRNARLQILAAATKYEPETPMYKKYYETIEDSKMSSEKPEFQELYARKKANAVIAFEESQKHENELRKYKTKIRKDLYWLDKRNDDNRMAKIEESIEKMDSALLKEFFRTLIMGGKPSSSTENSVISLPDITAAHLADFLKEITSTRNQNFEIHLKKCLQLYSNDTKKISDEAADLENDIRSLEKIMAELKKEKANENDFCVRLEVKMKHIEDEIIKKKEEIKEETGKNEEKWLIEIKELEEELVQVIQARDQAWNKKLDIQEAIRGAKIEENNLRNRFHVFQSLKKAEKEGKKHHENSQQLYETEKTQNDKIIVETEAMAKILEEAQKQEANLEKAIEQSFIPEKISLSQEALEAEKRELEGELEYLISVEQKLLLPKKKL